MIAKKELNMTTNGECSVDGCSERQVPKYLYVPHGESAMRLPVCELHAAAVNSALDDPAKLAIYAVDQGP